jgi:flagellar biogenesis protein FliO
MLGAPAARSSPGEIEEVGGNHRVKLEETPVSIVTILIIIVLVLLAIYLFRRVF